MRRSGFINTTRGIDRNGGITEIARPGYGSLAEQAGALSEALGGDKRIILTDAGIYSGGSLVSTIGTLGQYGITVDSVVLGLATGMGIDVLERAGVNPSVVKRMDNQIDWIEQRDFIPFMPLSGRVVTGGIDVSGISRAIPYILPDGDAPNWASIPDNAVTDISMLGWQSADLIWESIERLNGITVRVSDLSDMPVRVSYPGWDMDMNDLDRPVREIIADRIAVISAGNG